MLVRARVDLKKPDFSEINEKGYSAVDMHFHTRYSDTYTRVSKVIAKASEKGIGVAITDHNAIGGAERAWEIKGDVLVIPGIETTSMEGPHILSYFSNIKDLRRFYDEFISCRLNKSPYLRTNCTINEILFGTKKNNGIVSAAHPYCPGMMGIVKAIKRKKVNEDVLKHFDAVEAVTGVNIRGMTYKSIMLAEKNEKGITGGSDGHSLFELGRVVAYAKAKTPETFLKHIIEGKSFVIGKETKIATRIPSYSKTTRKHLNYVKPLVTNKARSLIEESMYQTSKMNGFVKRMAVKGIRTAKKGYQNGKNFTSIQKEEF